MRLGLSMVYNRKGIVSVRVRDSAAASAGPHRQPQYTPASLPASALHGNFVSTQRILTNRQKIPRVVLFSFQGNFYLA